MLISGTFTDLKTAGNGGRVNNTCAQVVGNNTMTVPCDLIFTSDAAGANLLSWEFESYNGATGAVNVWVNVPALSGGSVVYGWYGNSAVGTLQTTASGTWGSNFQGVYHLGEAPNGIAPQMNDSTVGGENGTTNGGMPAGQQVSGEIGGGLNFSGGSYYVTLANGGNFGFERTDAFSVSVWFKSATTTPGALVSKFNAGTNTGWGLHLFGGLTPAFYVANKGTTNGIYVDLTSGVSAGAWHHVVATYNGSGVASGVHIYVDGVDRTLNVISNTLSGSIINTAVAEINGSSGGGSLSAATLDEVRITAKGVVLGADWVATSYNNQSSPATFWTIATGITP